jgi:hypothetical protein
MTTTVVVTEETGTVVVEDSGVATVVPTAASVVNLEISTTGPAGADGGLIVGLFLVDASTPNVIYVGVADSGTAVSAADWLITKSTFNATGVRTSKGQANNVTWTGRTGHTYT